MAAFTAPRSPAATSQPSGPVFCLSTLLSALRGSARHAFSTSPTRSPHLDQLDMRFEPILAGLQGAQQRGGSGTGGQGF